MRNPPEAQRYFPETLEGAASLQRELAERVVEAPLPAPPRLVAGADLSYERERGLFHAAVVVYDTKTREFVELARHAGPVRVPYVSGFLSFREGPAVVAALAKLQRAPDLLLVDGQGRAHPRRCGIASHLGVALDLPTVGVAKSLLCGAFREPGPRRGASTRLIDRGELVGRVLRTRSGVRPLFISVGHRVTLEESCRLVLSLASRFRQPEPTRRAHLEVSRLRRATIEP